MRGLLQTLFGLTCTLYWQITEFKDKGYAIGLSCTHMHADPSCATLLIKAWSDCHRRASISNPPFFHPPALLPRPNLSSIPSSPLLSLKSSSHHHHHHHHHLSSSTFLFSASSIRSLLARLPSSSTPFSALSALFSFAISRANPNPSSSLTLATDFRKRMSAPLPSGFYGNAAHFSSLKLDFSTGFESVTNAIGQHIAGLEEEDYWSAIEWLAARKAAAFQMYGPELTCVKLDDVAAYGAQMEEGVAPAHVSCWVGGAEGEGVVMVLPAAEEEGRIVEVVLPAEVAEKVVRDEEIRELGPTVVFSGRI